MSEKLPPNFNLTEINEEIIKQLSGSICSRRSLDFFVTEHLSALKILKLSRAKIAVWIKEKTVRYIEKITAQVEGNSELDVNTAIETEFAISICGRITDGRELINQILLPKIAKMAVEKITDNFNEYGNWGSDFENDIDGSLATE
ncbi:hypothetical protein JW758_05495 [Candidatus Peregrinibacteria bacterium]|nr:hypothetical protein [Candidatus Peregrinibacteria bacterium]